MKRIAITGVMLCVTASLAGAGGLNFNWSTSKQCPTVATPNWDFACDRNDTTMYMVASFQPDVALAGFDALDARIDGGFVGPVPAWWQYDIGSCREAAFSAGVIDVAPTAPCAGNASTRLWTTQAYGGIGQWYAFSNRILIAVGFATAADRALPLDVNTQYDAFHIAVATTNTVAVAADSANGIQEQVACSGCGQGLTLALNQINLYGHSASDILRISGPLASGPNANGLCITYRNVPRSLPCGAVPARNATWGQLKSLYR